MPQNVLLQKPKRNDRYRRTRKIVSRPPFEKKSAGAFQSITHQANVSVAQIARENLELAKGFEPPTL